jgi:hypothetical protein
MAGTLFCSTYDPLLIHLLCPLVILNWGFMFLGLGIGDFLIPKNTNFQFKITNR